MDKARDGAATTNPDELIEDYIQRLKEGLHLYTHERDKLQGVSIFDPTSLLKGYLEGWLWIRCELKLVPGSINNRAVLTCFHAVGEVLDNGPAYFEGASYPGQAGCGQEKAVLIDVAKMVENPEGMSLPALIRLHFVDEDVCDPLINTSSSPLFYSPSEIRLTESERESMIMVSGDGGKDGDRYIVKHTSNVANSVSYNEPELLVGLMNSINDYLDSVGNIVCFNPDFIKVRREIVPNHGFEIENVFLCSSKLRPGVRKVRFHV